MTTKAITFETDYKSFTLYPNIVSTDKTSRWHSQKNSILQTTHTHWIRDPERIKPQAISWQNCSDVTRDTPSLHSVKYLTQENAVDLQRAGTVAYQSLRRPGAKLYRSHPKHEPLSLNGVAFPIVHKTPQIQFTHNSKHYRKTTLSYHTTEHDHTSQQCIFKSNTSIIGHKKGRSSLSSVNNRQGQMKTPQSASVV
jgi:hypothetical protein